MFSGSSIAPTQKSYNVFSGSSIAPIAMSYDVFSGSKDSPTHVVWCVLPMCMFSWHEIDVYIRGCQCV